MAHDPPLYRLALGRDYCCLFAVPKPDKQAYETKSNVEPYKHDYGALENRWRAYEAPFAMPIKVGDPNHWTVVTPVTAEWKSMPWAATKDSFAVATDLFYVKVAKTGIPSA